MKEKSLFVKFMGDSPFFAIVDFFLDNREGDFSKLEVINGSGISRGALFMHWSKLEDYGIVKVRRRFGKTKLFALNTKSPLVKKISEVEQCLIDRAVSNKSKKQDLKIKVKASNKNSSVQSLTAV